MNYNEEKTIKKGNALMVLRELLSRDILDINQELNNETNEQNIAFLKKV